MKNILSFFAGLFKTVFSSISIMIAIVVLSMLNTSVILVVFLLCIIVYLLSND